MEYFPPGCQLFDDAADLQTVDNGDAGDSGSWYADWLSGWRELARQARGTLLVARQLHAGRRATAEDWSLIEMLHRPILRLLWPGLDEWGFVVAGSRGGRASRAWAAPRTSVRSWRSSPKGLGSWRGRIRFNVGCWPRC